MSKRKLKDEEKLISTSSLIYNFKTEDYKNVRVGYRNNPDAKLGQWKNAKKLESLENFSLYDYNTPNYISITVLKKPSILPAKKYCDISGLEGKYVDPLSNLNYHSSIFYEKIRDFNQIKTQEMLKFKNNNARY